MRPEMRARFLLNVMEFALPCVGDTESSYVLKGKQANNMVDKLFKLKVALRVKAHAVGPIPTSCQPPKRKKAKRVQHAANGPGAEAPPIKVMPLLAAFARTIDEGLWHLHAKNIDVFRMM